MKVDELSEAIVGRGRHANALSLLRFADPHTLHKSSNLHKPVAEEAGNYLKDTDGRGHDQTQLGKLFDAKVNEPSVEPDGIGEKEGTYVQV